MAPPEPGATHFAGSFGAVRFNREFSGFRLFAPSLSAEPLAEPFPEPDAALLPPEWFAGPPGRTLFAAHAKLLR